MAQILPYNFL